MSNYDSIEVLKGLEGVRKNAGMYIGGLTDGSGYHHMLLEILSNSIDEFMNGYADKISVSIYKDGSASVEDNGRGIPVSFNEKERKSNLELALANLHAGGKFDKKNYNSSGGLHGVGLSVVTALSSSLKAIVWRDKTEYSMYFEKGKKVREIDSKSVKRKQTGTFIRFLPDNTIFNHMVGFKIDRIKTKLEEISFLCEGLSIEFFDENTDTKKTFLSQEGIVDFVKKIAPSELLDDIIKVKSDWNNINVNIALQWVGDSTEIETSRYYTNNIPNLDGGSHMVGFKSGLTKTINTYISKSDLPKSYQVSLSGDDVREGIVYIVSIKHPNPSYSSQTKDKLVSEDARTAVESIVNEKIAEFFEQNPKIAKNIIIRCVNSYKARLAAKKAKETVRKTVMGLGSGLPGKLADCQSKDPEICELYLVEGNSAAGSAKGARDKFYQSILPLRGKVLNTEKCELKRVLDNEELQNIITVLGCGFGKYFDTNNLRYNKIIIFCDADIDGSHIRTLLLTFFFRQMPQLIINGNIYIAQPPLYRIMIRNNQFYLKDDKALNEFISKKQLDRGKLNISRFKGLGEMSPTQLWEAAMNPETRTLLKIKIDSYLEADRIFNILMGNQVDLRREFIIENSGFANLDI